MTENTAPTTAPKNPSKTSASTWMKRGLVAALAFVALGYGAIFFYANVINDAPDALDSSDLSDAVAVNVAESGDGSASEASAAVEFDGVWVPTAASEFGYRVDEVLGGVNVTAVGRSNEIEGALTIDGTTASIDATVQVDSIESDDSRRDGAFRNNIMDTASFPTASFRTTEAIDFGAIPADGDQVTATATGELTLKGVTLPVTFEVTAQATAGSIGVLGNIPITFTDFGIDNPSNPAVSLEDDGVVEFVLVFERQA